MKYNEIKTVKGIYSITNTKTGTLMLRCRKIYMLDGANI